MISILILLPIASFLCLWIRLINHNASDGLRASFLRAAILLMGYAVLTLELLSPLNLVTRSALAMIWSLPLVLFVIWVLNLRRTGSKVILPVIRLPHGWGEWLAFSGILSIIMTTALIAWVAPPMTWDSMTYHMSRIAHWAQDRSVWHYITGIERQNSMSPGAEMISLHGFVLTSSDRFVTFTEWFSMIGSLVGVSLLARRLGGARYAQWLAVIFIVTLPMGITQASSTITDYVVAFWLVCIACEVLAYHQTRNSSSIFYCVLSSALAVLTKPTCVPYLLPFILWIVIIGVRTLKPLALARWTLISLAITMLITGGYLTRNLITYGGFSNQVDFKNHVNQLLTPSGFLSNVIKNAALHGGTPSDYLNNELDLLVRKVHIKMGIDIMDPRTSGDGYFMIRPPSYDEDMASNPYHALVALITLPILIVQYKKYGLKALFYSVSVIIGFIFYSGFYKWHLFNVRYHLSFFVLFAPTFGLVFGALTRIRWGAVVSVILWLTSFPWLVSVTNRPLLPINSITDHQSILLQTRENLRFSNCRDCQPIFSSLVSQIEAHDCSDVGIMLNGDTGEYLLWQLFHTPLSDLRMEWIVTGTSSDRYKPEDFKPCAVICEGCTIERSEVRGLPLFLIEDGYALYMRTGEQ